MGDPFRPAEASGGSWPPVPRIWPGETICLLAAGPSANQEQARTAKAGAARLIVINTSYRLAPWADLLYACDAKWWETYQPDFAGFKVTQDARVTVPGIHRIPSENKPGLSLDPVRIHQGSNSGYQALNLAVLLGAKRIILLGFDMRSHDGKCHWHGDHPLEVGNPPDDLYTRWCAAFATTLKDLDRAGVEVVNCTPDSALTCFPMANLEDVMREENRAAEHRKYVRAYRTPNYRMGQLRMVDAVADLSNLPTRGSYLDVGCGYGEMLDHATRLGFAPVLGTEVVPALIDGERVVRAEAHALTFPDRSFDVVTMFDVIEHLIPGDDEMACRELARVARRHILLTANKNSSKNATGEELHINRRLYDEWDTLFRSWFQGDVTWIKGNRNYVSDGWRVDLS